MGNTSASSKSKQWPYSSHAANWRRAVSRKRCHLPAGRSFSQAAPFRLYLDRVLRGAYLKKREERFPLSFSFIHLVSSSSLLLFSQLFPHSCWRSHSPSPPSTLLPSYIPRYVSCIVCRIYGGIESSPSLWPRFHGILSRCVAFVK